MLQFDLLRFFLHEIPHHNQLLMVLAPFVAFATYIKHWIFYCIFFIHVSTFALICLHRAVLSWAPLEIYTFFILFSSLLCLLLFIIRKDFIYPYFQKLVRFFRRNNRVAIWHRVTINNHSLIVNNLSLSGCFVLRSDIKLKKNETMTIHIRLSRVFFACEAKMIREETAGYGLEFIDLSPICKKLLKEILARKEVERFKVDISAELQFWNQTERGVILDISATGCFFETQQIGDILKSQPSELCFLLKGLTFSVPAIIAWTNKKAEPEFNKFGIGLKFLEKQNKLMDILHDLLDSGHGYSENIAKHS